MLRSGLLLMLLIAVGAAGSSLDIQRLNRHSLISGDYTNPLDEVQLAMPRMETGQRGYMITGDDIFLAPYTEERLAMTGALTRLDGFDPRVIGLTPPTVPIASLVSNKSDELDRTLAVWRTDGPVAGTHAAKAGVGRAIMAALRAEMEGLRHQGLSIMDRQQRHVRVEAYPTVFLIAIGVEAMAMLRSDWIAARRWRR